MADRRRSRYKSISLDTNCDQYLTDLSLKSEHVSKTWLQRVIEISNSVPNNVAVSNIDGNSLLYSEMEERSNQIANMVEDITESKLPPVIAVCLSRTNIDIVPIFLAILKLQSAVHLVEPKLGDDVNLQRLSKIKAGMLIVDEENSNLNGGLQGAVKE